MRNNGTKKAGISSRGSVAMGAALISPGVPVAKKALAAPMLTATTRSNIPRIFQRMNVRLAAKSDVRKSRRHGRVDSSPNPR